MEFSIELAKECDVKDVYDLSNDPIVRKNSFNSSFISWDDHVSWFEEKINNKDCVYYVIRNIHKEFIGQVRFDKNKKEDNSYIVGISLSKSFRGKGLGSLILKKASEKLFCDCKVVKIYAYIKDDNTASTNCFLKVGYKIIGKELINNSESLKLEYSQ